MFTLVRILITSTTRRDNKHHDFASTFGNIENVDLYTSSSLASSQFLLARRDKKI
jgi:hypothetical protein